MGGLSGAVAGAVSNPFFLLKTRFQATGSEDVKHQHRYTSLRRAFLEIGRTEGIRGYYRGLSVFVPRTAAASATQMSTYDTCKAYCVQWTGLRADSVATHFVSSLLTGVAVTLAMQPFDFTAVRLMNQNAGTGGSSALYTGPMDCVAKVVRTGGILGVYKGTLANYLRFGPYCTLTFVFLEQFRALWTRHMENSAG